MIEYVHVGSHADVLASGRSIGPGERVPDTDLNLEDGDQVLVDEGVLVDVASFGGESNQLSRKELDARAAELNIEGRSKKSTDELRQQVIDAEAAQGGADVAA